MNKLIVEYDADKGQAFSDNESIKYVDEICKTFVNSRILIGTEFLITLFRKAIVEKKIKVDEIKFLFKGRTISIDKYGCWDYKPDGFDNSSTRIYRDIINAQAELRKEDEKNKKG